MIEPRAAISPSVRNERPLHLSFARFRGGVSYVSPRDLVRFRGADFFAGAALLPAGTFPAPVSRAETQCRVASTRDNLTIT